MSKSWPFSFSLILYGFLCLIPPTFLFGHFFVTGDSTWDYLQKNQLIDLFANTWNIAWPIFIISCVLGFILAALTTFIQFSGRRFFEVSFILPITIPLYVFAFIIQGGLDFNSGIQKALISILPFIEKPISISPRWACIFAFSIGLYPYVYILCKQSFNNQGKQTFEIGQSLGLSPIHSFFKVILPSTFPWVLSGGVVIFMEVFADFGAVSVFNYDTLSTGVYKAWFGLGSIVTASKIASILLIVTFVLLSAESIVINCRKNYRLEGDYREFKPFKIKPLWSLLCTFFCTIVLVISIIYPILQLLMWALSTEHKTPLTYTISFFKNSIFLAIIGSIFSVIFSLMIGIFDRKRKRPVFFINNLFQFGYAIPGTVMAVSLFVPFTFFDLEVKKALSYLGSTTLFTPIAGSLGLLILGYLIRFQTISLKPILNQFKKIKPAVDESGQSLKLSNKNIFLKIHLPLIRSSLFASFLLVFIEIIKEMPLTLMIRPFGWDTLAVKIYEFTSEGEWEKASLPALILIFISFSSLFILKRNLVRKH